jgi:hypothetical protein
VTVPNSRLFVRTEMGGDLVKVTQPSFARRRHQTLWRGSLQVLGPARLHADDVTQLVKPGYLVEIDICAAGT